MAWSYAIYMIVFGFLMRGVDNWAHIGGFAGGFLAGLLLDPRKPETGNHPSLALVCLVADRGRDRGLAGRAGPVLAGRSSWRRPDVSGLRTLS